MIRKKQQCEIVENKKETLALSLELLLLFIWRLIRKKLLLSVAISRVGTIYKEPIKHETYCLLMSQSIKHKTWYILSFYVTRLLSTHKIQLIKLEPKNTTSYYIVNTVFFCHMLAITRKTYQTTCNKNKETKDTSDHHRPTGETHNSNKTLSIKHYIKTLSIKH